MKFDQNNRLIKLKGPFAAEEVCAISFSADESISKLPSFSLEFLSLNLNLTGKDIIGKNMTVEVQRFDDDPEHTAIGSRFFNGYVSRLSGGQLTTEQTIVYRTYHVEIVPWFWFLTQQSNCHIFFPDQQEKSILEIVENVFERDYHINPKWETADASILSSRKVEHCVQYRETDFNFVSRILEKYGVHYYFKHDDGEHTMVLSDKASYPDCESAKVNFNKQGLDVIDDHVTSWEHQFEFVSGKFSQTDYNFEKALDNLETKSPKISSEVAPDVTQYEIYDFPGAYQEKSDGDKESRIRQEDEEVPHNRVNGGSTCKTFCAGHKFQLASHPDEKLKSLELGEYLITSVQHQANQPFTSGTGSHHEYSNSFSCIPAKYAFRPSRVTPNPIVSGIQTGVVTGPPGEEIYTDEFGRIKVFFHWDRETRRIKTSEGQNCSCWIRVAQRMAGRKWGFMAIPRIGQEVIIEFLEGDPDRPLVVGSVYNSDQMPHYDPQEHAAKTYFKTNSTKGGDGYNELMFDDANDRERVWMHAQKDMDIRVLNDVRENIYNSRFQTIGLSSEEESGDQTELLYGNRQTTIKKHVLEHVEGSYTFMVGNGDSDDPGIYDVVVEKKMREKIGLEGYHFHVEGDRNVLIDKSDSLNVSGDQMESIGADKHLSVAANFNQKIGSSYSLKVGSNYEEKVGIKHAVDAGQEVHIKAGMKVIIEAGVQISLVGPGGFVDIGPGGVTIQGIMVKINSGGSAGSGSGASPKSPLSPAAPEEAPEAAPAEPDPAWDSKTGHKSAPD